MASDNVTPSAAVHSPSVRQCRLFASNVFESEQQKRRALAVPAARYDHTGVAVCIEAGRILQAIAVYEWTMTVELDTEVREAVERDFQVLRTLLTQGRRFELRLLKEAEWVLASDEYVLGRPVFRAELEERFGEIVRY